MEGGLPAVAVLPVPLAVDRRTYQLAKRSMDMTGALLLLLLGTPLWIAVAALIKLTSPGPILYAQRRCGRGGSQFNCYKFRTMIDGAHVRWEQLRQEHNCSTPVFKLRNDPRVTPVGRWLRKLSIDEVPQALNVLHGEMSLVGPRPPLLDELAQYSPYQLGRLAVKPGMSGLWQVSGRSTIGFDEWVELDLEYIRRRGFWYDCWLVLCTVPAVLRCQGAY